MQQIKSPDDIRQLGTILSFWAHPDDETFSCAGIMATAIANGQRVVCVTATRGEEGVQDESKWPRQDLAKIRTKELKDALKVLGITEHYFLNYHDGSLEKVPLNEGADHVLQFIAECSPDTILTFGPEGWTGHPDHMSISAWVSEACKQLAEPPKVYHWAVLRSQYEHYLKKADEQFNIYFNTDKPPIKDSNQCELCFMCPTELCAQKCAALVAMPSQMQRIMQSYNQTTLNHMFESEAFVSAK